MLNKKLLTTLALLITLTFTSTGCAATEAETASAPAQPETTVEATSAPEATEAPTETPVPEAEPEINFEALTKDEIAPFIVIPTGEEEKASILGSDDAENKAEASEAPGTEDDAKEDTDTKKPIGGFKEIYVLEGTEDFHPEMAIYYDDTIVTGITSDDSTVDYTKAGEYKVVYTVTISKDPYTGYVKAPEDHIFHFVPVLKEEIEASEETANGDELDLTLMIASDEALEELEAEAPDYTVAEPSEDDAVVTVEDELVVVVTAKEAEEKAKMNVPVYTDHATLVDERVAEVLPTPEAMAEESKEEAESRSETPASDDGNNKSHTADTDGTPTAAPQPEKKPEPTQPETKPEKTEHQHTWVTEKVQTKAAWDEKVKVKDAWDETVTVQAAYDEQVLVKEAWDEKVESKPAWDETVDNGHYEVRVICGCGADITGMGEEAILAHQHQCGSSRWYTDQVWIPHTETVHHDAEYTTVHHDAEYKTVHHDAVTEVKHHDAEYRTVHHDAEYTTVTKCSGCGATK